MSFSHGSNFSVKAYLIAYKIALKKRINIFISFRIKQSFIKLFNLFFRDFELSHFITDLIIRTIIAWLLWKIKSSKRICNYIIILSRNIFKCIIILNTLIILSIINEININVTILSPSQLSLSRATSSMSSATSKLTNWDILLNELTCHVISLDIYIQNVVKMLWATC